MSGLKILGRGTVEPALREHLSGIDWEDVQLADLALPSVEDEVWLVQADTQSDYINALADAHRPQHSVLWIPEGSLPLPFDDWWEDFSLQLLESRPEDAMLLQRVARCPQVLDWGERISDVPEKWFGTLTKTPRQTPTDSLPFSADEKRHLSQCEDCRAQVYDLLQQQAELHWAAACPMASEIGEWLESSNPLSALEVHVSGCGLCKETIRQQAWLWEEVGLINSAQAFTKLSSVGLAQRTLAQRVEPFLSALTAWKQSVATPVSELGALLIQGLSSGMTLHAATRSAAPPVQREELSLDDLADRLEWGEPLTYAGEGRWLNVTLENDNLLMRIGRGPSARYADFTVEFLSSDDVIISVPAANGVARLLPDHFAAAQQAGADRILIVTGNISAEGE